MRGRTNEFDQRVTNCVRYVKIVPTFRLREIISCEQTNTWHWIDLAGDDLRSFPYLCRVHRSDGRAVQGIGHSPLDRSRPPPLCYRHRRQSDRGATEAVRNGIRLRDTARCATRTRRLARERGGLLEVHPGGLGRPPRPLALTLHDQCPAHPESHSPPASPGGAARGGHAGLPAPPRHRATRAGPAP